MAQAAPRPDGFDSHPELFAHLAPQARLPRLPRLAFSPGKLPVAAEEFTPPPAADEIPAAALNNGEGGAHGAWRSSVGH